MKKRATTSGAWQRRVAAPPRHRAAAPSRLLAVALPTARRATARVAARAVAARNCNRSPTPTPRRRATRPRPRVRPRPWPPPTLRVRWRQRRGTFRRRPLRRRRSRRRPCLPAGVRDRERNWGHSGRHTGGLGRLPPNKAYLLAVLRLSARRRQRRAACASTCRSSISTARSSMEQPTECRHALSRRDSVLRE